MLSYIRNYRKRDDYQFYLETGLKNMVVPAVVLGIVFFVLYLIMELNSLFFLSSNYLGQVQLKDDFMAVFMGPIVDLIPLIALHFLVFFLLGLWMGRSLLRPFTKIKNYCELFVESQGRTEVPLELSEFPLLEKMVKFFFQVQRDEVLSEDGRPKSRVIIPEEFSRIHGPFLNGRYYLNFFVYILVLCTFSALSIFFMTGELYEGFVEVAVNYLHTDYPKVSFFLQSQSSILEHLTLFSAILLALGYFGLSVHFYSKISTPAFGIFSSMRSYLKGQKNARVHLVGFRYLREQTREINRCLDWLQKKDERE